MAMKRYSGGGRLICKYKRRSICAEPFAVKFYSPLSSVWPCLLPAHPTRPPSLLCRKRRRVWKPRQFHFSPRQRIHNRLIISPPKFFPSLESASRVILKAEKCMRSFRLMIPKRYAGLVRNFLAAFKIQMSKPFFSPFLRQRRIQQNKS